MLDNLTVMNIMKKINSIFLLFVCLLVCVVCGYAHGDILRLQDADALCVVWDDYDGTDTEIFVSQKMLGSWTEPKRLTDNDSPDFSPCVALDKKNRPWVVWVGNDGISTAIYSRFWNGETWSKKVQVDSVDIYEDTLPCIMIDDRNQPWVVWSGYDGRDDDIYLSSWSGVNWKPEEMVNEDDFSPDIAPVISAAPDNKKMIVSWTGYNGIGYELYHSFVTAREIGEEKTFGFAEAKSFGECPSITRSDDDKLQIVWLADNNYYSAERKVKEWQYKGIADIKIHDSFLSELLFLLQRPVWVAWDSHNLRQNFRLLPRSLDTIVAKNNIVPDRMWDEVLCFLDPIAEATTTESKYIAFGDSITNGRDLPGYPPKLELKLDEGIGPSIVYNAGVSGERTTEGILRIDSVLDQYNAEFITIMEGTNDVTFGYSRYTLAYNLSLMIDMSRAHDTVPFIGSLTPREDGLDQRTQEYYNPKIEEMADDKEVPYVDMYAALNDLRDTHFEDGKHPNEEGYWVVATKWYEAIYEYIDPDQSDDGGGGCGSVTLPIIKGNGRGLNFGILFFIGLIFVYIKSRLLQLR